jgi:ketosteroid isomerase-like protein
LEFDTISPAGTITKSYQSFKDLWEPTMQASTKAKTAIDDNIKVTTNGNMGLTTFTFRTEFTDRKTGKKYAEHAHASMVWEKQDGHWVIIHEHVSSPVRIRDKLRSDRSCQAGLRRWLKEKLVATSYMFRKRGNNQLDVGFTNRFDNSQVLIFRGSKILNGVRS